MIVLRDEGIKQKLYPIAWGARNSIDTASHLVLLLARKKVDTLADAPYITHLMHDIHHLPDDVLEKRRTVYHNFLENDFRLLGDDRALFDWASKQTYIMLRVSQSCQFRKFLSFVKTAVLAIDKSG